MKKPTAKYIIISIILSLILFTMSGCFYIETSEPSSSATPPPTEELAPSPPAEPINPSWTPPVPESGTITTEMLSFADVVAQVKPSVVAINTEVLSFDFFNRPYTQEGAGSGWILDKDGIIVTNNHVVEGAQSITVTMDDGRTFQAQADSVYTDSLSDLAIIKIDAGNLPALNVGSSDRLRIGDWVLAIGNALGRGISSKEGTVSRLGVSIPVDQGQTLYNLIETSAAINPGNSGGPLVNLAGEVIGITSAKLSAVEVEGIAYAISTETAMPIIESLVKTGYVVRPWLGVGLYTVNDGIAQQMALPVNHGAIIVDDTIAGSPAAEAGLQKFDVIVAVDGVEINSDEEVILAIHNGNIGQAMEITFWRGNTMLTTNAILVESPPPS